MRYKLKPIAKVWLVSTPKIKGGTIRNPLRQVTMETATIRNVKMTGGISPTGSASVELIKKA